MEQALIRSFDYRGQYKHVERLMCCAADKQDIISVLLLLYEYKYDEKDTQSACYLIPYERKAYLSSISTLIQTCILDFYRNIT